MPVSILRLDNGHSSLEFSEDDIPQLSEAIGRLFDHAETQKWLVHDNVCFGGAEFTYYQEWEDLCLISNSDHGDACLERLHATLSS